MGFIVMCGLVTFIGIAGVVYFNYVDRREARRHSQVDKK